MKKNLITDVIQGMLPYLNNAQTERLQEVLQHTLFDYEVSVFALSVKNKRIFVFKETKYMLIMTRNIF